ncbi:MAG: hypothetical protein U0R68_05385 [Candidatus Nanopelagicales bacterium]
MTGPGESATSGGPTPEEDAAAGLPPVPSDLTEAESREVGEIVGRLGDENISKSERAQQMVRLAGIVGARTRRAGGRAVASGKVLADLLIDALPHIPVRDLETLTEHHKGLAGEALADALVRNAARTTAGIGAAGGAVAAAEWATLPLLVTVPLEVVVETVAVAAVEVKLVAELHAVYGVDIPGTGTQRATAFAGSWATRRGLDPMKPWTIPNVLGIAGRQQLGKRMIGRFARNLGTVIPFLVGAVVGATVNSNETKKLAVELRTDLRRVQAERMYPSG